MKKISIVAGLAALAVSGTAVAQTQGGFQRGDRGGDITRQQALERADQMFQRLDLNRDGQVTREEAQQAREQMRVQMGERRAQRGGEQNAERTAKRAEWAAKRGERAGQRGQRGEGMFGANGVITQAEFRQRALERFDRMDLDRNGVVTAAERQQARAQMKQQMQQRRAQ
jgi:hypothetical protein